MAAMKTTEKPSYQAQKQRMKARSRAFHRLAALHRPDFLRLLHEEQAALDAEAATKAAAVQPARLAVRDATGLDDPGLRYIGVPVNAPAWWIRDYEEGEL